MEKLAYSRTQQRNQECCSSYSTSGSASCSGGGSTGGRGSCGGCIGGSGSIGGSVSCGGGSGCGSTGGSGRCGGGSGGDSIGGSGSCGGGGGEIGCPMVESEVGLLPTSSKSYGNRSMNRAWLRNLYGYNDGKSMVVLSHNDMESNKGVMSTSLGMNFENSASLRAHGYNGGQPMVVDDDTISTKGVIHNSPMSVNLKGNGTKMSKSRDGLCLSERWAGPTYSNSPPPSHFPIPNFSTDQKTSVSIEFPLSKSGSRLQKVVKSAPTSPKGDSSCGLITSLSDDVSATRSLRGILNLNISDD